MAHAKTNKNHITPGLTRLPILDPQKIPNKLKWRAWIKDVCCKITHSNSYKKIIIAAKHQICKRRGTLRLISVQDVTALEVNPDRIKKVACEKKIWPSELMMSLEAHVQSPLAELQSPLQCLPILIVFALA